MSAQPATTPSVTIPASTIASVWEHFDSMYPDGRDLLADAEREVLDIANAMRNRGVAGLAGRLALAAYTIRAARDHLGEAICDLGDATQPW